MAGSDFKPRSYQQLFNTFKFVIAEDTFNATSIQYTLEHCGVMRIVCACGASTSLDAACADFEQLIAIDCRRCGSGITIEHLERDPYGGRSKTDGEVRRMCFLPGKRD